MAKHFRVELVSVEAMVWSGEADMVVARTTEGELGVLAGHAPLLGQLGSPAGCGSGAAARSSRYDIAGGFLSVTEDGVTVLAESAMPAEGPSGPVTRRRRRGRPHDRPSGMRIFEVIGVGVLVVLAGLLVIFVRREVISRAAAPST